MDFLEYSDISFELKGCMTPGKLKMTDQHIVFKDNKTGKLQQIPAGDFELVNFQNFAGTVGIRLFLKDGSLHRFVGFKESDKEKIAKFFSQTHKMDMLEKELCMKGWNWGTANFAGSVLSFNVGNKTAFEVPLNYVSQCTAGRNEIAMEFHQNDDAPVSLMEMRFFIPSYELAGDIDPVDAFQKKVIAKASVINVSGDAIAIFREVHCLTPRGRYDIKIFQTFFQLHGKTFDYKIPISTVLRLFLLPHKDNRQMFFVVRLDPPIKQGQTRYHFLVLLFGQEESSIELPFTEGELRDKYENKLAKEISGPTYEVLGKVMKAIVNRKIIGPGNFVGYAGTPAIGCSFKAAAGYLYPLERGFIYVHKPPVHIKTAEISSVNFARGGGSTRSFDFEIELKSGTTYTFNSIEKEEHAILFDFITSKKLYVKNKGKNDKNNYNDEFDGSDIEGTPDTYLERVKAEAQERDDEDDNDDDESDEHESTDEDFNPSQQQSGVGEDSDHVIKSSSSMEESGTAESEREQQMKSKTKQSDENKRHRKRKKKVDSNKPKRAASAFMLWLNDTREKIKADNPGIKVTEIAKKGGELWKNLEDKSVWENKAAEAKKAYQAAMKKYEASKRGEADDSDEDGRAKETFPKKSPSASHKDALSISKLPLEGEPYKSKEYVSDDDTSSADDK